MSWTEYFVNFNTTSNHSSVSFCGLKMVFPKLSQLDITPCLKNCVYSNFSLHCFMSSIIGRHTILLYKSSLNWKSLEILQSQPPEVFHKKAILKNFVIITVKRYLCYDLFLIKVAGLYV